MCGPATSRLGWRGKAMKRTWMVVLAGVLVAVTFCGVSDAAAPGPHFSNLPLLRPEGGTEPAISIGGDGTMAITALNMTYPLEFAFTNLWKGPFGGVPAYQGPIDRRIEGSYGGS